MNPKVVLPLLLVAGAVLLPSCKRKQEAEVRLTEEAAAPSLSSAVHVADPKTSNQLLKGFYDVEQGSWRWTMGKFSVVLRTPAGAAQNGAKLVLKLAVPDAVLKKASPITLSAKAGSEELAPEKFTKSGDQEYTRDIPASACKGDSMTIDFALDKFLPAGAVDSRELGVIVTSIAIEPK